jgi:hypothetical protein
VRLHAYGDGGGSCAPFCLVVWSGLVWSSQICGEKFRATSSSQQSGPVDQARSSALSVLARLHDEHSMDLA